MSESALSRPFDRILLDAPCSGLGVLRRHPDGKWYKTPNDITQHRLLQRELLAETSRLLRPGGCWSIVPARLSLRKPNRLSTSFVSLIASFSVSRSRRGLPQPVCRS